MTTKIAVLGAGAIGSSVGADLTKAGHDVRINDQWRVCFVWRNGDAHEVEITDYH